MKAETLLNKFKHRINSQFEPEGDSDDSEAERDRVVHVSSTEQISRIVSDNHSHYI